MASSRNSFKAGSCEMLILFILKNYGDCYAYQLSQLIRQLSNDVISFPEGSLYPAFYRLIDNEYVSDYKKQAGKRLVKVYYHLEPKGEQYLKQLLTEYHNTINSINMILDYDFSNGRGSEDND
ncbi:MAG: PadR family transcriptional regulator [Lachnospiraceae bacterium]|nr:PadR family transcriptional regulator [Lachnospiraceae bacterium]